MIIVCFSNIVFNFIGFICELGFKVELLSRACYAEKKGQTLYFSVPSSSEMTISTHVAGSFGIYFYIVTWHTCISLTEVFSLCSLAFDSSLQNYPSFTTPHSICTHFPFPLPTESDTVITEIMEIFNISMEWFLSSIYQLSL